MKKETKGEHNKNLNFEKNLTVASGGKALEEAAPLWRFSHFGAEDSGYRNCQLCHSRMKLWLAIRNAENGVVLFIGHDCYDKLVSFLVTKKLESLSLGSRKEYISAIKKYCKKNITESFLTWFGEQEEAPEELRVTLAFIEKFGYAPTIEAAEALVAYYKVMRRFKLGELLDYVSHRSRVVRELFRNFAEKSPLEEELSLGLFNRLDLSFADSLSLEEMDDEFFKEAFRKTLPTGGLFASHIMHPQLMTSWIESARNAKVAIVDEAWKLAMIDLQKQIASQQESYRLLSFWRGKNPKHHTEQWEARDGGKKYVLDNTCSYNPSEGSVFVKVTRELVENRVFLVSKLVLVPSAQSPLYVWVSRD